MIPGSVTTITKLVVAVLPSLSVAVRVTVLVPTAGGVPLKVRVPALTLIQQLDCEGTDSNQLLNQGSTPFSSAGGVIHIFRGQSGEPGPIIDERVVAHLVGEHEMSGAQLGLVERVSHFPPDDRSAG